MTVTQDVAGGDARSARSARSGLHLWVALLLALLLLVSWFMGYGPGGSKCAPLVQGGAAAVTSSVQPAPAVAVPAETTTAAAGSAAVAAGRW